MPHDEQGQNLVRTHTFLDSSGNKLTIKFREPTMCYRPANTKPHTGEHVCPPTLPALIGGIIILLLAIAFLLILRAPTCLTR